MQIKRLEQFWAFFSQYEEQIQFLSSIKSHISLIMLISSVDYKGECYFFDSEVCLYLKGSLSMQKNKLTMKLQSGAVTSYFRLPNNAISNRRNTWGAIFFGIFACPATLSLIVSLITSLQLPDAGAYHLEMYVIELTLLVVLTAAREIYLQKLRGEAQRKVNEREFLPDTVVYRNRKEMKKLRWGDLTTGDILFLQQGQRAPADLLLLDSQQIEHRRAVTYVDMRGITGEAKCQRKMCCYPTQDCSRSKSKLNWINYQQVIDGKLTFQPSSGELNSFTGYLKLSKDPRPEQLSIQNVVLRESVIKTGWVYGLIIYAGMECKIMKHHRKGVSPFIRKSRFDTLFLACLLANLFFGSINAIIYSCIGISAPSCTTIAYHFMQCSIMLPHFLYIADALLLLYFSFYNKTQAEIINYSEMSTLGEIDFAIVANAGVLHSRLLTLQEIVSCSSVYQMRRNQCCEVKDTSQPHLTAKPFKYQAITQTTIAGSEFQIDDEREEKVGRIISEKYLDVKTQLDPLLISYDKLLRNLSEGEEESVELLKAFVLCNQAKFTEIDQDNFEATSFVSEEEVLLRLVSQAGWNVRIRRTKPNDMGLEIATNIVSPNRVNSGWLSYDRRINTFAEPRNIFSVVVEYEGRFYIYCKGSPEQMMDRLRDKDLRRNMLEGRVASYRTSMAEVVLYGRREMSNQEYQEYESEHVNLRHCLNASKVSKRDAQETRKKYDEFSWKYENELQFLCIAGLASECNPLGRQFARYLSSERVKLCVLANHTSQLHLLKNMLAENDSKLEYVHFTGSSAQQIRYFLNVLTRKLKANRQHSFSLILDGTVWDYLRCHSDLLKHFLLVFYHAQSLIAYCLSPEAAAEFTKTLRQSYPREHRILSVGSTFSHLLFQSHSHVSVSLDSQSKRKMGANNAGSNLITDIRVRSIRSLQEVIQLGSWFLHVSNALKYGTLYRTVMIGTVALGLQFALLAHSASYSLHPTLVLLYIFVFGLADTLYTLLIYRTIEPLRPSRVEIKATALNLQFYRTILEGCLHGVTIITSVLLIFPNSRLAGGKLLPVESLHFSLFLLLTTISTLRHAFSSSSKCSVVLMFVCTAILMVICCGIAVAVNPLFIRVIVQLKYLMQCYDAAVTILNTTIFCSACSFFIHQMSSREEVIEKISRGKTEVKCRQDVVNLVRHLFSGEENVQDSVRDLVGDEMDVNEMSLNRLAEIRKREERLKEHYISYAHNIGKLQLSLSVLTVTVLLQLVISLINGITIPQVLVLSGMVMINLTLAVYLAVNKATVVVGYYKIAERSLCILTALTVLFGFIRTDPQHQIYFSLVLSAFLTQLIHVRIAAVIVCSAGVLVGNLLIVLLGVATSQQNQRTIGLLAYALACFAVNMLLLRRSVLQSRISFVIKEANEAQTNQINDIMSILVPDFVRNLFLEAGEEASFKEESAAILFCYVCNFQSIINEEGTRVVQLMDELFRQFDKLCNSFAVQKIETVGYTYMAATGIRCIERELDNQMVRKNKVERLMLMAVQLLEKTKNFRWGVKRNKNLEIKIGIHCGEVMIGVIGEHKKQFSLIGTTVNTTSRHCSTGINGSITLSEVAYRELLLQPTANFQFKQDQKEMKGLSTMNGKINVYRYNHIAPMHATTISLKRKFKQLVLSVIKRKRFENKENLAVVTDRQIEQLAIDPVWPPRFQRKRKTTSACLQRNLQQIELINASRYALLDFYTCLLQPNGQLPSISTDVKQNQKKHHVPDRLAVLALLLLCLSSFAASLAYQCSNIQIGFRVASIALLIGTFFVAPRVIGNYKIGFILAAVNLYLIAIEKLKGIFFGTTPYFADYVYLSVMANLTLFATLKGIRFIHMFAVEICIVLMNIALIVISGVFQDGLLCETSYMVYILMRVYEAQRESIINTAQRHKFQCMSEDQAKIVSQLLPKHAYEKLKNQNIESRLELTDQFSDCTILFADIKGFTEFSNAPENKSAPENVVRMLRQLFEAFDRHCVKRNVYKVYTIGDCYVVLGFTNCYERNPAKEADNVVQMGFDMIETIAEVRKELNFQKLDMRIGVHTGTIIGGIIGTEIVRYDIYGEDVMIANKFEEKGKVAHIHISETTKRLLEQLPNRNYEIKANGQVTVQKLNVTLDGFLLTKSKFTSF